MNNCKDCDCKDLLVDKFEIFLVILICIVFRERFFLLYCEKHKKSLA